MAASGDKSFFPSPTLLEESESSYCVKSSTFWPGENNTVWCYGSDGRLHNIDKDLLEMHSIYPDCTINDICTNPISTEVFCCSPDENSVRTIDTNDGATSILFNTESDPLRILCTYNKQIVVAMAGSVCMYTFGGKVLHTYTYEVDEITSLSISEETNDIAVAMASSGIVVLDDELNKDYEYHGDDIGEPESEDDRKPLNYSSVLFVDRYIIASDKSNNDIHVLDGDEGSYIRSICVDEMSDVLAIGLQKEDNNVLIVGCRDPMKIISIRYAK